MAATIHILRPGTRCPTCHRHFRPRREPTPREPRGFPFILPRPEPWFALGPRPWIIQVNPHGNPQGPSHQWMESVASRSEGFTEAEARSRLTALSTPLGNRLTYRAFNVKTHAVVLGAT